MGEIMDEGVGASKHIRNSSGPSADLDASSVRVTFSPDVLRGLARVEAAVHGSQHFSPDILQNLQENYTSGKPMSVERALTAIAYVIKEAMEHVNATGDARAKEAVDGLLGDLLGLNNNPPITLAALRTKGR